MEPFLGPLIRYQELNLELSSTSARLAEIPTELKAIDDEQESARVIIKQAKERHEASLKKRRDYERELQDLEGKVDKYNDQSREVKTNEQYRAIMGEIQTVKDKIGQVEEKILLSMDETDALQKEIGEAEKQVAQRKPEFDAKRKVLTDRQKELETLRDSLQKEKEEIAGKVRPDLMEAYTKVASTRGEIVLSRVADERCQGCNVRLRPALAAEVRKNDALHQCESCRRILYWIPEPAEEASQEGQAGGAESSGEGASPAGDSA